MLELLSSVVSSCWSVAPQPHSTHPHIKVHRVKARERSRVAFSPPFTLLISVISSHWFHWERLCEGASGVWATHSTRSEELQLETAAHISTSHRQSRRCEAWRRRRSRSLMLLHHLHWNTHRSVPAKECESALQYLIPADLKTLRGAGVAAPPSRHDLHPSPPACLLPLPPL